MTPKTSLLIDVDSTIPNLALMHISAWRKSLGYTAGFNIDDPEEVWASVVFSKNRHKADGLKFIYPDAKIDVGGSGVSLSKRLPGEVDRLMPDYSLYPGMDYDLGFTTRGCGRSCYFCVVPRKEGKFRVHQHPAEFHDPAHRSAVYMDNNILWDKQHFFEVTDWLLANRMTVDFNQGLDLRLMDRDVAKRIAELTPRKYWHFAFDSLDYREEVENGIRMLKDAGVNVRHKVNVYVYLHDSDQVPDALERCRILKGLGTLPYIMVNRETERTQDMTDLKRWTRPQIFFTTDFSDYRKSVRKGQMCKTEARL